MQRPFVRPQGDKQIARKKNKSLTRAASQRSDARA